MKKDWINYETNMISVPDMMEVFEILESCFDLSGQHGKIGRLIAEFQMEAIGYKLTETPARKETIFEPGIKALYGYHGELTKIETELYNISQALKLIEKGETQTVEIQLKLNKGKSKSAKTITIQHPETISLILDYLNTLPKGTKPKPNTKGRKEATRYNELIKHSLRVCFELVEDINPEATEDDKLFFTGLILSMAGIFENPRELDKGRNVESSSIPTIKGIFADRLKYYKSAGK